MKKVVPVIVIAAALMAAAITVFGPATPSAVSAAQAESANPAIDTEVPASEHYPQVAPVSATTGTLTVTLRTDGGIVVMTPEEFQAYTQQLYFHDEAMHREGLQTAKEIAQSGDQAQSVQAVSAAVGNLGTMCSVMVITVVVLGTLVYLRRK
jgi:hypothetical protein